jgi:hypothetical protein
MRRQNDFDPVRLRLAEQALSTCERLGLKVFASCGRAGVGRMVNAELLDPPAEWDRVIAALGPEIAHLIDWRGSFVCGFVERLPGGCGLYWPDWQHPADAFSQGQPETAFDDLETGLIVPMRSDASMLSTPTFHISLMEHSRAITRCCGAPFEEGQPMC